MPATTATLRNQECVTLYAVLDELIRDRVFTLSANGMNLHARGITQWK